MLGELRMYRERECGAVLILVLVFLLLLNIVASGVLQSATLQTRMAGNSYTYVEALQVADRVSRSLVEDPNNFLLTQEVGALNCFSFDEDARCTAGTLRIPEAEYGSGRFQFRAVVSRQLPRVLSGEVLEIDPEGNIGQVPFSVGLFELEVNVAGAADAASEARISTGVAVPLDGAEHWVTHRRELGLDAL